MTVTFEGKVSIVFEDFEVGYDGDCRANWLAVHDGDSSDSPWIGSKLCGNDIPSPMNSTGDSMTLVFHSDDYPSYDSGFKIMTRQGAIK